MGVVNKNDCAGGESAWRGRRPFRVAAGEYDMHLISQPRNQKRTCGVDNK